LCADDYSCLVCRQTIIAWPGTRESGHGRSENEEGGVLEQIDRALNPTVKSYIKERTARNYLREHLRAAATDESGPALLSIDEAICAATSGAEVLVDCDLAADHADRELLAAVAHYVSRSLQSIEVHIGRTSEEETLHRLLQTHAEVSEKLTAYKRHTEDRRGEAAHEPAAALDNAPGRDPAIGGQDEGEEGEEVEGKKSRGMGEGPDEEPTLLPSQM
jgi:hypothetical protein